MPRFRFRRRIRGSRHRHTRRMYRLAMHAAKMSKFVREKEDLIKTTAAAETKARTIQLLNSSSHSSLKQMSLFMPRTSALQTFQMGSKYVSKVMGWKLSFNLELDTDDDPTSAYSGDPLERGEVKIYLVRDKYYDPARQEATGSNELFHENQAIITKVFQDSGAILRRNKDPRYLTRYEVRRVFRRQLTQFNLGRESTVWIRGPGWVRQLQPTPTAEAAATLTTTTTGPVGTDGLLYNNDPTANLWPYATAPIALNAGNRKYHVGCMYYLIFHCTTRHNTTTVNINNINLSAYFKYRPESNLTATYTGDPVDQNPAQDDPAV